MRWWRILPDVEAVFRRFPVLAVMLLDGKWQSFNATGYLLVNAADMEVKR
jgi:hypothetical protein